MGYRVMELGQQVMERPMMPMLYRKPLTCAVSRAVV